MRSTFVRRFNNSASCLLMLILLGAVPQTLAQESDFPGVKSLMSVAEFEKTGLDKLSKDEIEALDAWLVRYTAGEAQVLQTSSKAVREAEKDFEVESRLLGSFTGWSGQTVFRLDNGQVWQQRLDGRYRYRGPANPAVRISRNWLGFYRMTVVDTGKSIGVTPLR